MIAHLPPPAISLRLSNFELRFKNCFGNRPKFKSNLPGFLERFLQRLCSLRNISFAQADKNIGPVAVTLEQYIKDALVHILDTSTYEFLAESEALTRDADLRLQIKRWIFKSARFLDIDTRKYLRSKLDDTKADLFGCFIFSTKVTRLL